MTDTATPRTVTTVAELKELIGQQIGVTEWVEMTQERVNLFAEATGDFQYIHVDPERAAQTFFGGTVAHGFLTLSLGLPEDPVQSVNIDLGGRMGVNYGLNKVRFPAPVPVGKRIRKHTKLLAVDEIGEAAVQMTVLETTEVEGEDKPACVAELVGADVFLAG